MILKLLALSHVRLINNIEKRIGNMFKIFFAVFFAWASIGCIAGNFYGLGLSFCGIAAYFTNSFFKERREKMPVKENKLDQLKKKYKFYDPTLEKCSSIRVRLYKNDGTGDSYHWFAIDDKGIMSENGGKESKYQYLIDSSMFTNDGAWRVDESSLEFYDKNKNRLPVDRRDYEYSFLYLKDRECGFIFVWPRNKTSLTSSLLLID